MSKSGNLLENTFTISPRGDQASRCQIFSAAGNPLATWYFQHGTLRGAEDTNGVTVEDLIAITIDRITALNQPPL